MKSGQWFLHAGSCAVYTQQLRIWILRHMSHLYLNLIFHQDYLYLLSHKRRINTYCNVSLIRGHLCNNSLLVATPADWRLFSENPSVSIPDTYS